MIGIFDSGLGGLTVARAIMDELPGYDITYFGDTARTPYGAKSAGTVEKYALEDIDFLLSKGARVIVMACNSASSVVTEPVIRTLPVPVFEVISPAVVLAAEYSRSGRIGVIGTRATINSNIYKTKILEKRPRAKVFSAPCPLLVPLVEEGWINKPETAMIIKKYLRPLKMQQIDTLILGCTHYPILKKIIARQVGARTFAIDSATAVARSVRTHFEAHPEIEETVSKNGRTAFYVSDMTAQFRETAQMILKRKVTLEPVSL